MEAQCRYLSRATEKKQNVSPRIDGVPGEIFRGKITNKSQNRYLCRNLLDSYLQYEIRDKIAN
jgi:hypothetical protein